MFMAFQLTRGPRFREFIEAKRQDHIDLASQELLENDDLLWRTSKGRDGEALREMLRAGHAKIRPARPHVLADSIDAAMQIAPAVFATRWSLFRTESDESVGFVTSDEPVVLRTPGAKRIRIDTDQGLNPELEITFPVSPSVMLIAHQHADWPKIQHITAPWVADINLSTVGLAKRYVFASGRANAELCLELSRTWKERAEDFDPPLRA